MALVLADRVRETTTVVGTGTATLLGAITGFRSFAAVGNANTTYYTITHQSANEWEVGIGTYTSSGTTLSRDTVLSSSNGGLLVNFSAGTKDVWVDYSAEKAVTTDTLAYPPAIGGTTPNAGTFTEVAVTTATGDSAFNENDTITGWLYSGKTFSVSGQESNPTGLFIGSAGTKMYINGTTGDDVNEYTLGTAWDITTATFVTVFSTAAQDTAPNDVFFKPDGLIMYVIGSTSDTVSQYTLGTAWSIATASYASKQFNVATQENAPTGVWFKPDGTIMYVTGTSSDSVFQYTLSTAWDVSTASYGGIFYSVAAQETAPSQVNLSDDGLKMWLLGSQGDDIWEYNLGTAWNVSTATPVNNFYIGFQEVGPGGLFIDSTAPDRVYVLGNAADAVFQYNTTNNAVKLDTSSLDVGGALRAGGNFVANANAYVDGTFTVQGATQLATTTVNGSLTAASTINLAGATTSTTSLGTAASTGTFLIGGTGQTGSITLGQSTVSQTTNIQAGATTSGNTKTINFGTAGLSGSTTNINIGSAVSGSLGTTTISAPTVNIGQLATQFSVVNAASAVNFAQVTGGATNNRPTVSSQGSDTDIGFNIVTKGSGTHNFASDANIATSQFQVTRTQASAVNYLTATGAATNFSPRLFAAGTDTNISQVFQSKGTGAINLAPGSSGVNISNGGTVTAITRTAAGGGYTGIPSVALSAPTTAGGVQATATTPVSINVASVSNGGTGYTLNDVITVVGGTFATTASRFTVSAVSGGVVTGLTASVADNYTVFPSQPASTTGGTGTGLTLTSLSGFVPSGFFVITNAGSGYVEQPTVTFSGGGGSGAAAYATVGSGTTVKSIGSTMSFSTPFGEALRVLEYFPSGTSANYIFAAGRAAGNPPVLGAAGSDTNISLAVTSKGTGGIAFTTSNGGLNQFQVAHTASAVNFVQVTGGSATNNAVISTQGSDTNVGLTMQSKGIGGFVFFTGGGRQAQIVNTASAVNFLQLTGAATGADPVLSAQGSDTNIDLVLQPKGTGALQAQQTDSTATGGNARGANAVDWQTARAAASQVASGAQSVVTGGSNNTASQQFAVVGGGTANNASAYLSYIGGGFSNTTSRDFAAVTSGYSNTAAGFYNYVGGGYSNSGTSSTAVTTQSATMNGTTAVTLSGSNANIRVGQYITGTSITTLPPTFVAAISGTSLTLSQAASGSSTSTLSFFTPHGVVVGGGNNQATGAYSFIGGGGDAGTAANRNVASGDWSFVGGGAKNVASGPASVIAGGGFLGTSIFGNTASADTTFVGGGILNVASNSGAVIAGGWQNISNGILSTVGGGRYATARGISGVNVFSTTAPIADNWGVSQSSLLIIGRQTTDATATRLTSDTAAAGTTNQVIMPNNSAYFFRGEVVAGVTGGGNTKGWTIEGVIKRGANAASTTLVGTPTVTSSFADAGASTWVIAVTADTTNGGLAVTFTGQAATTIRTVAQIRTTEMTY